MRAVRQPRRTRERRTTSVESAAVGFIQFIIRARSDDIFLSFSLCDTQQASVTGKKTLLERGFLLALKWRKGVVVFTVLGARTTEASAFDSIRFDSIQNVAEESRISNLCDFEREKDSAVCRRREKNARDRSVPRRGKVVSIPLRVIFVVLVECPFGISDLSLDLMNEREREREIEYRTRARRRTKRDRGREDKGF